MISDYQQFSRFTSLLPALERDEVFFVSLSARDKYLSEAERKRYSLGRSEMFMRKTAHGPSQLQRVLFEMQAQLEQRRTRSGERYPQVAMTTYMNVNPSSMTTASMAFAAQVQAKATEVLRRGETCDEDRKYFGGGLSRFMTCVQKARSQKHFIDIDVDTKDLAVLDQVRALVKGTESFTIATHGGFHTVIRASTLTKAHNLGKLRDIEQAAGAEVCINSNAMVPVPGTLQSGRLVTLFD